MSRYYPLKMVTQNTQSSMKQKGKKFTKKENVRILYMFNRALNLFLVSPKAVKFEDQQQQMLPQVCDI